jgi:hypothetical protein
MSRIGAREKRRQASVAEEILAIEDTEITGVTFNFTNHSVGRAILQHGDCSSIIKVAVGTDVGN